MKYQVIVTAVSGKGKKIFGFPDIVSESDFQDGAVPDLVKKKFIRPLEEKIESIKEEINSNDELNILDYDDITKKELQEILDSKGIAYSPIDKKQVLYDLYVENS